MYVGAFSDLPKPLVQEQKTQAKTSLPLGCSSLAVAKTLLEERTE